MRATIWSSTAASAPRLEVSATRPGNKASIATVRIVSASRSPRARSSAAARRGASFAAGLPPALTSGASMTAGLRGIVSLVLNRSVEGELEGLLAGAAIGREKVLTLVLADGQIGLDDRLDGVGHPLRGEAWTEDVADVRIVLRAAAERDLVVLRPLLIDAQDADVAGVMVAAGVDASGDVEPQR